MESIIFGVLWAGAFGVGALLGLYLGGLAIVQAGEWGA